jgi:phosphomannomutase/phosphoglucomutase
MGKGVQIQGAGVPAKKGKGGSINALVINTLVVIILIIALCGAALVFIQDSAQRGALREQAATSAEGVAKQLSEQMLLYRALILNLASDPLLPELFLQQDRAALDNMEKRLKQRIPHALRVHLLPAEWSRVNEEPERQLSYATLTMLRAVERSGKAAPAEIHQFNTPQQHIAFSVPVLSREGRAVFGVMHVTLPMELLEQGVQAGGGITGALEVQQSLDNESFTLVSSNPSVSSGGTAVGKVPVTGSIWQVAFHPGETAVGERNLYIDLGIVSLGLLLIAVFVQFTMGRLKKGLERDQAIILRLVENALQGRKVQTEKANVAEHQGTLDRLVGLAQEAKVGLQRRAAKQSAKAAAEKPAQKKAPPVPAKTGIKLPKVIFRAYDVRGVVERDLTPQVVFQLGRAIGSEAYAQGQQTVIMARDGRLSSSDLAIELCRGLMASGRDVLDLGVVPTPVLYFATHFLGSNSGVMITGSHNPPEYNGLKIVIGGETLSGDSILALRQRLERGELLEGEGTRQEQDLVPDYISRIMEDVQLARPLKVVLDCGNGAAGVVAPTLLKALGCEVIELFCEVNGNFPNHHPDPGQPENLQALIAEVKSQQADIGIAFDGDGDRLGVVDSDGKIIWPDRLMMLFARDVLSRQPGTDVIFDVKSTRHLAADILAHGGRPLMWKTGHSLLKAKLNETGALLAGEMSGHFFFKERWYGFDDALYACARLLELLSFEPGGAADMFAGLPESVTTPELNMITAEGENFVLVETLIAKDSFSGAKLITIDGVRAEFENGWGLARPSNTTPSVMFRFEADDEAGLQKIQEQFRQQLLEIKGDLKLPF